MFGWSSAAATLRLAHEALAEVLVLASSGESSLSATVRSSRGAPRGRRCSCRRARSGRRGGSQRIRRRSSGSSSRRSRRGGTSSNSRRFLIPLRQARGRVSQGATGQALSCYRSRPSSLASSGREDRESCQQTPVDFSRLRRGPRSVRRVRDGRRYSARPVRIRRCRRIAATVRVSALALAVEAAEALARSSPTVTPGLTAAVRPFERSAL